MVSKSKFLSLVLRHDPSAAGVRLDENGWVAVSDLLEGAAAKGAEISMAELEEIVKTNEKKHFSLCMETGRIRARQGHSLAVDVQLQQVSPPEVLYHGTAEKNVELILKDGLRKMNRQHVHLSADIATARMVGMRHGKPVLFEVDTKAMDAAGRAFYLSENGVWLVDGVEKFYLRIIEGTE